METTIETTTSGQIDFDPGKLAERLGGGDIEVRRIPGGQSNPTYFVDHGGRQLVLRKPPSGNTLPSAHAVDREYRIMAALAETDVPVPRMVLMENDPEPIGTSFYLMERLAGRVMHDSSLPELQPADRAPLFDEAATVLAHLHAVDWRAVGLDGFGRPGGYFSRQVSRWTKQWQLSKTREDSNIDALCSWLSDNIPPDEQTSIVHGDFRLGNMMIALGEPRIVGLLDWELSTLGHPLADLAHFCTCWDFEPDQLGGIQGLDLPSRGLPSRERFVDAYVEAGGCNQPLLPFHRAFALFRFAVIFEGIAARHKSGNAAAEDAEAVGGLSAISAQKAVDAL